MDSDGLRLELAPLPTSAAEARRFVGRVMRAVEPPVRDVGILLTSELVTNALLYTQGRITLSVTPAGPDWRIAVADDDRRAVHPRHVGPDATSGRGLALVDRLASSWGVRMSEHGKEIWFEVAAS